MRVTRAHIHISTHRHKHSLTLTQTHTLTHSHTDTHTYTYAHTYIITCHTYIHTYLSGAFGRSNLRLALDDENIGDTIRDVGSGDPWRNGKKKDTVVSPE